MPKSRSTSARTPSAKPDDIELIETTADLERFVDRVMREHPDVIALDTEFIPESRFVPQLCLVQVAIDGYPVVLIDPLAVDSLDPLRALVSGPLVVVHAGAQDLALIAHAVGMRPERVFDTQVAGSFLTRYEQASLAELIRIFLGTTLGKQHHTFTRWDNRPLKRDQLRYAADDVAYLLPLFREQDAQLEERDRTEWVDQECRRVLLETPLKWEIEPDERYRQLPKASSLSPRELAVLRELHRFRDEIAREQDQRPGNVISDHKLVRLAAAQPRTLEELADIRQLPSGFLRRHGSELLDRIDEARGLREQSLPEAIVSRLNERHLSAEDMVHLDALMMVTKIVAQTESIAPAVLAKKEWLAACLRDGFEECLDDGPLAGWRAEVLGPVFEKWREGRLRFGLGSDARTGKPRLMLFDEETGLAEALGSRSASSEYATAASKRRRRRRGKRRRKQGDASQSASASQEDASPPEE